MEEKKEKRVSTYHSTILEREIVWKLVGEVAWNAIVPRESAVVRGSSREDDIWA